MKGGTPYSPVIHRVYAATGAPREEMPPAKLECVVANPEADQIRHEAGVCTAMKPARAPNRTITRAPVRILLAIVVGALMAMCAPVTATASATQPTCTSPG